MAALFSMAIKSCTRATMHKRLRSRRESRHTGHSARPFSSTSAMFPQRSQRFTTSPNSCSARPSSRPYSRLSVTKNMAKRCAVFSPTPGKRESSSIRRCSRSGSMGITLAAPGQCARAFLRAHGRRAHWDSPSRARAWTELQIFDACAEHFHGVSDAAVLFGLGDGFALFRQANFGIQCGNALDGRRARGVELEDHLRGRAELVTGLPAQAQLARGGRQDRRARQERREFGPALVDAIQNCPKYRQILGIRLGLRRARGSWGDHSCLCFALCGTLFRKWDGEIRIDLRAPFWSRAQIRVRATWWRLLASIWRRVRARAFSAADFTRPLLWVARTQIRRGGSRLGLGLGIGGASGGGRR